MLFSFGSNKSIDPDGFTTEFFWIELKPIVMECVEQIFRDRPLLKSTITSEISESWTVSCFNLIYKLLTKILFLADRLSKVTQELVSTNLLSYKTGLY